MRIRSALAFCSLAVIAAASFGTAAADEIAAAAKYPAKSIRFINPYSPGGSSDFVARLVAQRMSDTLGQQVIVENRPGAEGNVGTALVARAAPDGYTLLLGEAGALMINPNIYQNVGFDAVHDFAPIVILTRQPYLLVVPDTSPFSTVSELIEFARSHPGKLSFGSSGPIAQVAGAMLKQMASVDIVNVPYKGSAPAMTDLLGKRLDFMFSTPDAPLQFIRQGKLRALAVTTRDRVDFLPSIPTLKESGFPDFEASGWYSVLAPAGTPPEIVAKLNRDIDPILQDPAIKEKLGFQGIQAVGSSVQSFTRLFEEESKRWADLLKFAGVEPR